MSSMCGNGSGSCGCGGHRGNQCSNFVRQLERFVGETVTIFTTSGGASGCGFTGVVLSVNNCFVRLVTDFGEAPGNPLAENICGEMDHEMDDHDCNNSARRRRNGHNHRRMVGSVCEIPIDRIAAFCHNAV